MCQAVPACRGCGLLLCGGRGDAGRAVSNSTARGGFAREHDRFGLLQGVALHIVDAHLP